MLTRPLSPDSAYELVQALVAKFNGLSRAQRREYTETKTRQAFIFPLSRALGWVTVGTTQTGDEGK